MPGGNSFERLIKLFSEAALSEKDESFSLCRSGVMSDDKPLADLLEYVLIISSIVSSFDVKCMQTNFGGPGLSGFEDFAFFQIWPNFPFRPWTIVYGGQKTHAHH